jgi:RNA polymerase sigma factor (TIGR02999 family)
MAHGDVVRGPLELADGVPLVYEELRRLAGQYMRRERPGHTLQPTALVHEAYLQMARLKDARWQNRVQFFAIASQVMRRILVSHARRRQALKRSSIPVELPIEARNADASVLDVLTVDDLLQRLEQVSPVASRLMELRFFGGLTTVEAGEHLGVSRATVKRHLNFGRAWIYRELHGS